VLQGDQLELLFHTSVIVRGKLYIVSSHGLFYFRYVVNQGHKVLYQATIPGGQVTNPTAVARAKLVQDWINWGVKPEEIVRRIRVWKRRRR
jgi:hypothetical protein